MFYKLDCYQHQSFLLVKLFTKQLLALATQVFAPPVAAIGTRIYPELHYVGTTTLLLKSQRAIFIPQTIHVVIPLFDEG